jgi:hypothetical protein
MTERRDRSYRAQLNEPVRWKWVVAVFVFFVGAVQEHWAWIFVGLAGAVAVLLYASGARPREIPGLFFGFAVLALLGVAVLVLFDIGWYVGIDGCTIGQAWQEMITHRDVSPRPCP